MNKPDLSQPSGKCWLLQKISLQPQLKLNFFDNESSLKRIFVDLMEWT